MHKPRSPLQLLPWHLTLAVAGLLLGNIRAFAFPEVLYTPDSYPVYGNLPWAGDFSLTVTAPDAGVTYPITVSLSVECTQTPLIDASIASQYVQLSASTLTFTAPGQKQTVKTFVNFPESALNTNVTAGTYSYRIMTHGWPDTIWTNNGAAISAQVMVPGPVSGSPPSVTIVDPLSGPIGPYTQFPVTVPFTFAASTDAGSPPIFRVSAAFATCNATPLPVAVSATSMPSATVSGSGFFTVSGPGTYVLQTTAENLLGSVTDTHTFIVENKPRPTITINTPANNSAFSTLFGAMTADVPFQFTATTTAGFNVDTVSAKLDGVPVAILSSVTLGTSSVVCSGLLPHVALGAHTFEATAVSDGEIVTTSASFIVQPAESARVGGTVFFDINSDNTFDAVEFGIGGVALALQNTGGQTVATTTSAADGTYLFPRLAPGSYVVAVTAIRGMTATAGLIRNVSVQGTSGPAVDFGMSLDFRALRGMTADGYTIGFWKNNLDKALGDRTGTQVNKNILIDYTEKISDFGLLPFDGLSMSEAVAIMESKSSKPIDLLAKQLVASQYNYQDGAYIGGDRNLTLLFVWWGEHLLSHAENYSSSYLIWAKDWFDAYNNSHGGVIAGPAP